MLFQQTLSQPPRAFGRFLWLSGFLYRSLDLWGYSRDESQSFGKSFRSLYSLFPWSPWSLVPLSVGIVGSLLGQGFGHSILYVSFPQMVGGMGAGILPLSKIYAANLHGSQAAIFSQLAPATTLGNILCHHWCCFDRQSLCR